MVTKVFNSVQESLMDLAVSAELEFSSGMFSGSAAAKVGITKKDGFKTLVTSATLDVQLVQLSIAKYAASDIQQDLVTDFNNLPTSWTYDPLAFQGFLSRWGTHVLVRLCALRPGFPVVLDYHSFCPMRAHCLPFRIHLCAPMFHACASLVVFSLVTLGFDRKAARWVVRLKWSVPRPRWTRPTTWPWRPH